jgi:lysophospholipase L1-like esterase
MSKLLNLLAVLYLTTGAALSAEGPVPKKGARVAIVGDSITEQKIYSRFIEDYFLACVPELGIQSIQLGWGGEQAVGFAARMENDLFPWKPDVVTTCYGMNDGHYRAYEPSIGEAYEKAMADIVGRLKAAGATVVVGSPGVVDTRYFRNPSTPPEVYNENLGKLRDIARKLAGSQGMPFADVHGAMLEAMTAAKEAFGKDHDVGGMDGVHPRQNGHLVMAYAFLKAMGFDGQIARIAIDLKGKAMASEGHNVVSFEGGKATIESSRYPFCFTGDEKSADGTRSILRFVPFDDDLNRFALVVTGLDAPRAKVSWGAGSKVFAREALEKGVNLAAEFLENPFSRPFAAVDEAVARKQNFETPMIKEVITRFRAVRGILGYDTEALKAIETLRARLTAKDDSLAAEARGKVTPVRHTIAVTPE